MVRKLVDGFDIWLEPGIVGLNLNTDTILYDIRHTPNNKEPNTNLCETLDREPFEPTQLEF